VRGADHPRRASVSSFGFGGSNFHLALEEYRAQAPRLRSLPSELVVFTADDAAGLLAKRAKKHACTRRQEGGPRRSWRRTASAPATRPARRASR
jgi:acyl transferase domain-containing protein